MMVFVLKFLSCNELADNLPDISLLVKLYVISRYVEKECCNAK